MFGVFASVWVCVFWFLGVSVAYVLCFDENCELLVLGWYNIGSVALGLCVLIFGFCVFWASVFCVLFALLFWVDVIWVVCGSVVLMCLGFIACVLCFKFLVLWYFVRFSGFVRLCGFG